MGKIREEFEGWAKSQFDIDCSEMSFGVKENYKREQYHNDDDPDGAITISAMFYAWKASRDSLCVELTEHCEGLALTVSELKKQLEKIGVSLK